MKVIIERPKEMFSDINSAVEIKVDDRFVSNLDTKEIKEFDLDLDQEIEIIANPENTFKFELEKFADCDEVKFTLIKNFRKKELFISILSYIAINQLVNLIFDKPEIGTIVLVSSVLIFYPYIKKIKQNLFEVKVSEFLKKS